MALSKGTALRGIVFNPLYANKRALISLISLLVGFTFSPFLASADSNEKLTIQTENQKVQLHAKDYPLGKLLQSIHDETEIQIKIPSPLNNVPVNAKIQASDWKSALKKLFQGNSRFELWGKRLATSKIWL